MESRRPKGDVTDKTGRIQDSRSSKRQVRRRTQALMLVFGVLIFIPIVTKLWEISIVKHEEYSTKAKRQQTKDVKIRANRGTIYDRNGDLLSMSATVYDLILSPLDVIQKVNKNKYLNEDKTLNKQAYELALSQRKEYLIQGLLEIFDDLSREELEKRMNRTESQYEVVKKNIEREQAELVRQFLDEADCGYDLWLAPTSKRYYPNGTLASHVIGFVNDNGGAYGIEAVYDEQLQGKLGRIISSQTSFGTEMYNGYYEYFDAQNGDDVTLTIDSNIQAMAEKALKEGITTFDVQKGGFCIVMNPKTGEIYAMASSPDYDPNQYGTVVDDKLNAQLPALMQDKLTQLMENIENAGKTQSELESIARTSAISELLGQQWRSQAYQDTYDPGSTFKAVVLAMALEEGVVSENDTFYCPGYYEVNGQRIHCSKRQPGHGTQTLTQAVENSCNPAFMMIGQRIGAEKFYEYFEAFGMKNKTGLELAGEGSGLVWSREYFTSLEGALSLATASFGQQFKVTPVQMITGFSAVINGGNLVTPHVVKSVASADGSAVQTQENMVVRQVVSQQTSDKCREILESVVANGTGRRAQVAGYRIGGKTGTSETLIKGEVIVSFIGFAPAEDPQVIVLMGYNVPNRPLGSNYGTTGFYVSGGNMPTIMTGPLIANILDYLGVPRSYTDDEAAFAEVSVPSVSAISLDTATSLITRKGFSYRTVGSGATVNAQVPSAGAMVAQNSTIILYLGDERPPQTNQVPNVAGLNYAQAKKKLEDAGFFLQAMGIKSVSNNAVSATKQSHQPDTQAALGTVISVHFIAPDVVDGGASGIIGN